MKRVYMLGRGLILTFLLDPAVFCAASPEMKVGSAIASSEGVRYIDDGVTLTVSIANQSQAPITIGDIAAPDWAWRVVQFDEIPSGWILRHRSNLQSGPVKPPRSITIDPGAAKVLRIDLRDIFTRIDLQTATLELTISVVYANGSELREELPYEYAKWHGRITLPIGTAKDTEVRM